MSLVSFLQRVFGSEPERQPFSIGHIVPKPGPLGTWVRKHPFQVALGWGLGLVLLGLLPLDGLTRPTTGPDILTVDGEDRARMSPELQSCLSSTGEFRQTCPALEQTGGEVP